MGGPASYSDPSGTFNALGRRPADGPQVNFSELVRRFELSEHAAEADRTLFDELLRADAPMRLLLGLGSLSFEVRKDAVRIFGKIVRLGAALGAEGELAQYFRARPDFIATLLEGMRRPELTSHFGLMLRACGRDSELAPLLFGSGLPLGLVAIAGEGGEESVEVSLEAFATLRELLHAQKALAAGYLADNFDGFFATFNKLLQSHIYMVQRQALRLLGDLLLDPCFMKVTAAYARDEEFLKIHMTLLRSGSEAVQLEAFHVFKLFVSNPRKPLRVHLILFRNQDRIATLLETMASGRCEAVTAEDARAVARVVLALGPPRR